MSTADDQELFRPLSDVTGVDVSMHIASIGYSDAAFGLPARLREHAAWREKLASPYDTKGAQWARDLREAAKDVERYRWLRDHGGLLIGDDRGIGPEWPTPDEIYAIVNAAWAGGVP